jgi:hypothetical protein
MPVVVAPFIIVGPVMRPLVVRPLPRNEHSELRAHPVRWIGFRRANIVWPPPTCLALGPIRILEWTVNINQTQPDDLCALKEIIEDKPADPLTMQRLVVCNLVEKLEDTAILTESGIEAATRLV